MLGKIFFPDHIGANNGKRATHSQCPKSCAGTAAFEWSLIHPASWWTPLSSHPPRHRQSSPPSLLPSSKLKSHLTRKPSTSNFRTKSPPGSKLSAHNSSPKLPAYNSGPIHRSPQQNHAKFTRKRNPNLTQAFTYRHAQTEAKTQSTSWAPCSSILID